MLREVLVCRGLGISRLMSWEVVVLGGSGVVRLKTLRWSNPRRFSSVLMSTVPDIRSRVLEVVVVRRIINLGTGNSEWGGNGKRLGKGRSVYE